MSETATRLYTPEMLGLATGLARWPLDPGMPFRGRARSASCGSTLELSLARDDGGRIANVGLLAQACAVGQASAAIFAVSAQGRTRAEIAATLEQIGNWLAGGVLPDWPGFAAIAPARDFPGRHGAIVLAWRAALDALPS